MARITEPLLEGGLARLAGLLPRGYAVARSSLAAPKGDAWIMVRHAAKPSARCLVIARRRLETRDLGAIVARAEHAPHPVLVLSAYVPPAVRERMRGARIGYWDLAGNADLALAAMGLRISREAVAGAKTSGERTTRSLAGEMGGRIVRALVDRPPPFALGELANEARVELSCASRIISFLARARLVERRARGRIEGVDWQALVRRWTVDAPLLSRGERAVFVPGRDLSGLFTRLRTSAFLHAITGEWAFAALSERKPPEQVVMYVEDVACAAQQLALHHMSGAGMGGNAGTIVLVKPSDRSVFHRSWERDGLRFVSPSLMAGDIEDGAGREKALAWLAEHEQGWRRRSRPGEAGQGGQ